MIIQNAINSLDVGLNVIKRKSITERDLLHHLVCPLFESLGWPKTEIYFEYCTCNHTPDITLIETGYELPFLTIEAKAPNVSTYSMRSGQVISKDLAGLAKRDNPLDQLFNQLINIRRRTPRPYGCLVNGSKIGVFATEHINNNIYQLACLESFEFSRLRQESELRRFAALVSRQSLTECGDRTTVQSLDDCAKTCFEAFTLSTSLPQSVDPSKEIRATLPPDADKSFTKMAAELNYTEGTPPAFQDFQKTYKTADGPTRKLYAFECLRFCRELAEILPSRWQIEFKRTTNIIIQINPVWTSVEIQRDSRMAFFLLQLKADGDNPGHVWYRIPKHAEKYPQTSHSYIVFREKLAMENSLKKRFGLKAKLDLKFATEYILHLLGGCSKNLENNGIVQGSFSYPNPFQTD